MKCPKCGYVSHDYLDACGKCRTDWIALKRELHLAVLEPGDLDLSLVAMGDSENFAGGDGFSVEDSFFSSDTLLVDREEVSEKDDDAFDIEIDDDRAPDEFTDELADAPQEVAAPAEHVKPEEGTDFVMIPTGGDETVFIDLGAVDGPGGIDRTPDIAESPPTVDMIDMSDLVDLDDDALGSLEETVDHLSETTLDQEPSPAAESTPASDTEYVVELEAAQDEAEEIAPQDVSPEIEPAPEPPAQSEAAPTFIIEDRSELGTSQPETEEMPPRATDTPGLDETVQFKLPERQDPTSETETPEVSFDLASDDLLEAELELELDEAEDDLPEVESRPGNTGSEMVLDVEELELEEDDETAC